MRRACRSPAAAVRSKVFEAPFTGAAMAQQAHAVNPRVGGRGEPGWGMSPGRGGGGHSNHSSPMILPIRKCFPSGIHSTVFPSTTVVLV